MVPPTDGTPDFDLIRQMADTNGDALAARDAWALFYARHHSFLFRSCSCDHAYSLGAETVRELVQDAFVRAFRQAGSFDCTERCDSSVQQRKVRGWLSQIIENLVRDKFRGQPDVTIMCDEEIERLGPVQSHDAHRVDALPETERLQLVKAAFSQLSEAEQTILRATMFWWQPGQEHQRMPNAAIQELSKQIGKSPDNIRQIRGRATKKIERYVRDHTSS
jgi:RNA polymerase sigma factor (sigma-70 family)